MEDSYHQQCGAHRGQQRYRNLRKDPAGDASDHDQCHDRYHRSDGQTYKRRTEDRIALMRITLLVGDCDVTAYGGL
jgi:hypothetical protein